MTLCYWCSDCSVLSETNEEDHSDHKVLTLGGEDKEHTTTALGQVGDTCFDRRIIIFRQKYFLTKIE